MMLSILAVIQGQAIITAVITLLVFGLIFWLLWWLVSQFAVPEPFNKIVRVLLAVLAVVVCINALLSIIGQPFIVW